MLSQGETVSSTFKTAGTYEYYCEPHQGKHGTPLSHWVVIHSPANPKFSACSSMGWADTSSLLRLQVLAWPARSSCSRQPHDSTAMGWIPACNFVRQLGWVSLPNMR